MRLVDQCEGRGTDSLTLTSASCALALAAALPSRLTLSSAATAPASRHAFLWLAGGRRGVTARLGKEVEEEEGDREERGEGGEFLRILDDN